MTTRMKITWHRVFSLLTRDGRAATGPTTIRYATAPSTMMQSRAMTAAVSQTGTLPSRASMTKTVASSNLSATGSNRPPRSVCQPKRLARKPSMPSDAPAMQNNHSVSTGRCPLSAIAIGTTRRIRIDVMTFGSWRSQRSMSNGAAGSDEVRCRPRGVAAICRSGRAHARESRYRRAWSSEISRCPPSRPARRRG